MFQLIHYTKCKDGWSSPFSYENEMQWQHFIEERNPAGNYKEKMNSEYFEWVDVEIKAVAHLRIKPDS